MFYKGLEVILLRTDIERNIDSDFPTKGHWELSPMPLPARQED